MRCDRCDGETKKKTLTSKKNGKDYTVFECLAGCKNPNDRRYAYSFFPPREEGKSIPQSQPRQSGGGDAVNLLRSIDTTLKNILTIVQKKSGVISVQENELQPDDEFVL